jgi:hypothetical protein
MQISYFSNFLPIRVNQESGELFGGKRKIHANPKASHKAHNDAVTSYERSLKDELSSRAISPPPTSADGKRLSQGRRIKAIEQKLKARLGLAEAEDITKSCQEVAGLKPKSLKP